MKAVLEFQPAEDWNEHTLAVNGPKYFFALGQVAEMLRKHYKYMDYDQVTAGVVEKIRDEFFAILLDRNINLEEVQ